ncbi:uncharacterized protein [Argopecten irradians]|uniref:uncharacterized protein n=1 Tax=Argopecten irradians TaxID=31199 RepID=UPI0037111C22
MDAECITHLDEIVESWARKELKLDAKGIGVLAKRVKTAGLLTCVPRRGKLSFNTQGETEFRPSSNDTNTEVPKTLSQTVLKTTFNNYTDWEQKHAFKCERSTQVIEKIIMTNGFKLGTNLGVQLGVPRVANTTLGIHSELSLGRNTETNKTHTLTWNSDSSVLVPKHTKVIAEMKVEEREFIGTFESKIVLNGIMVVDIKDQKRKETIHTVSGYIAQIVDKWSSSEDGRMIKDFHLLDGETTAVWTVRGTCYFRYGVEQTIETRSEPLIGDCMEYAKICV